MKKFYKFTGIFLGIFLVLGIVFVTLGAVMGAKGVVALTKDYGIRLLEDMDRYEYEDMDLEPFTSVNIEATTADINIVPSKDGKYGVDISLLGETSDIEITNENGVLSIKDKESSDVRIVISLFSWSTSYDNVITVYVPSDIVLEKMDIACDVGDINVEGIKGADALTVSADVGDVDVTDGVYGNLDITVDTGDVNLEDIHVNERVKADMDVGDMDISGLIEGDIYVEVNVGDVDIAPGLASSNYMYEISVNLGEVEAFGQEKSGFEGELTGNPEGKYYMQIITDVGNITVED